MADRTMVDYTQKIKPYFEGIAPIEPTTTAAHTHAVGDVFYLNGTKVKCTTAISVGDTIAIGTNVEEADDVESEIQALTNNLSDEIETRAKLGAHQLLDLSLENLKKSTSGGTWTDNVFTPSSSTAEGHLKFTLNSDSSITANGTAQADCMLYLSLIGGNANISNIVDLDEDVVLSGCPSGGSNNTYMIQWYSAATSSALDYGSGVNVHPTNKTSYIRIIVKSGQSLNNLVFKPLIKLASDPSNEFTPYAKTNRELTLDTNAIEPMLNVLGAKNLLPNNATSQTVSGVTFIVNSDGTVNVNGTATAQINFSIKNQIPTEWIGKSLKLSGCPIGGGSDKYELVLWDGDASAALMRDFGNGASGIPLHTNSWVNFTIRAGATFNNAIIKPMIRPASIEDDTYVPYAMTNRELTSSMLKTKLFGNIAIDSLTLAAGASGDVKKNATNISYADLGLKAGSIKAVILTWSTGHVCVPTQIYASGGNNIVLALYNPSSSSVTVTQVDLQVFYTE